AQTLKTWAVLEMARGKPDQAVLLSLEAAQTARKHKERIAPALSERQQLALNEKVRSYLNTYLTATVLGKVSAEQVYSEVLAWKGDVWVSQQELRRRIQNTENPKAAKLYGDLAEATPNVAFLSPAPLDPKNPKERLDV